MLNAKITAHVPQPLAASATATLALTAPDSRPHTHHAHKHTHTHLYGACHGRSIATWQPLAFDGKQMLWYLLPASQLARQSTRLTHCVILRRPKYKASDRVEKGDEIIVKVGVEAKVRARIWHCLLSVIYVGAVGVPDLSVASST